MLYNLLIGIAAQHARATVLCGSRQNLAKDFLTLLDENQRLQLLEAGGVGSRFVAEQRACLQSGLSADAILFPNYYVPPVLPRRLGRVGVVIHDFQYRHFPQYFSARKRAWLRVSQAAAMRLADRVIVISNFVRDDALRLYGDRFSDKIVVIPNALSWARFAAGIGGARPCASRYVLAVAAQYPHKNLETLIRAFALVARADADIQLVLCGQSYTALSGVMARRVDLSELIETLGLAHRIRLTGFIDDDALAQWYGHAEMFVFPSLFEGFGMPPVEALSFGLPTLVSNATAMPETTMGLAHLVDNPHDPGEWAAHILSILRAPEDYRPNPDDVLKLRARYDPVRIGAAYLQALGR
jgi:glycosyltransferase involved in cell wall biosynthesis